MPHEPVHAEIEKAERWAVMEWILIGRRLWVLLCVLLLLALGTGLDILYADGLSHLSHKELRTFIRRQEEERLPRSVTGPLFGRLSQSPAR